MNHQEREFSAPMLTDTTAKEILSPSLTVQSQNMAVIPTSGMNEAYCYEFLCEGREGQKVLVYINSATGAEEQVLILIESDNGVLTV